MRMAPLKLLNLKNLKDLKSLRNGIAPLKIDMLKLEQFRHNLDSGQHP